MEHSQNLLFIYVLLLFFSKLDTHCASLRQRVNSTENAVVSKEKEKKINKGKKTTRGEKSGINAILCRIRTDTGVTRSCVRSQVNRRRR